MKRKPIGPAGIPRSLTLSRDDLYRANPLGNLARTAMAVRAGPNMGAASAPPSSVHGISEHIPCYFAQIPCSWDFFFPASLSRELREKCQQQRCFWLSRRSLDGQIPRNSLQNSLFAGNWRGDGCDQHCIASHPVRSRDELTQSVRKPRQ
jgi:hypothetical protein